MSTIPVLDLGPVIVNTRGAVFDAHCLDCGWNLWDGPSESEVATVGMAHMSTHDEEGRHRPHGFVMIGRKGERS